MLVNLKFIGQDYTKLEATEIIISPKDADVEKKVNENKIKIIMLFLDKMSKEKIIINYSQSISQESLYKRKQNAGSDAKITARYDGFVGIIRGDLTAIDFVDEELKSKFEGLDLNIVFQIQSRLDVKNSNGEKGRPYFLSTLLFRDKLNLNENTVPENDESVFDYLLLYWFKTQLQKAYLKGFYRTYQRFEKNDEHPKGSIDIARHIRLNMGLNNGKIAYSYRENSVNNYLNHMIIAAYDHLKKKYYELVEENFDDNIELKSIVDRLRQLTGYEKYHSYQLIAKNMRPISHPYYMEYEKLRKTCMMILRDEGINFLDGDLDEEINGVLFYLPDLWEKFLEKQLRVSIKDISVTMKSQDIIKVFGKKEDTKKEDTKKDTYVYEYQQETRPDYVFYDEQKNPFMILDAKFKPSLWKKTVTEEKDTGKKDEEEESILDDYTKCCRDMTSIDGYSTGVIFPINEDEKIKGKYLVHSLCGFNKLCRFYTFPVSVPYSSEDNYIKWSAKFNKNLNRSQEWIKKAIEIEYDFWQDIHNKDPKLSELEKKRKEKDDIWFKTEGL